MAGTPIGASGATGDEPTTDERTAGIPIPSDDPHAAPALLERSGTIIPAAGHTFVRIDLLEAVARTTPPPTPVEPTADTSTAVSG